MAVAKSQIAEIVDILEQEVNHRWPDLDRLLNRLQTTVAYMRNSSFRATIKAVKVECHARRTTRFKAFRKKET
jgi:hypothetical protein